MVIKVNGKEVYIEKEMTIRELFVLQHIAMPDCVIVQVNETLVEPQRYNEVIAKDQDTVEFIFFMGGGSF